MPHLRSGPGLRTALAAKTQHSRLLGALAEPSFGLVWLGQLTSFFGNALHAVALPFQIFAIGGGPVQLGIGAAIGASVAVLPLPWAGALVDKWERRRVLMVTDVVSFLAVAGVGLLSANGLLRIEHLYIEAAILGLVYAFFLPAARALTSELVGPDALGSANALRASGRQIALMLGAAAGGVLVSTFGVAVAFLADAMTFGVSFVALALARPRFRATPAPGSVRARVAEGVRFAGERPWLAMGLFANAIRIAAFHGPMLIALPVLIASGMGGTAALYGWMVAGSGLGAFCGGLHAARIAKSASTSTVYVAGAIASATLAAVALGLPPIPTLALVTASGWALSLAGILWETTVQRHVPAQLLGRVTSLEFTLTWILTPLAAVAFGVLIELAGPQAAIAVGGLIGVGAALAAIASRRTQFA